MHGVLRKMVVTAGAPVEYALRIGCETIPLNVLINKALSLSFTGEIICIACGKMMSRSFAQGYCYQCFLDVPECSPCIIRPELCRAHEGIGRDMEWERKYHLQEQAVYLAHTGIVKVGVTRFINVLSRWFDQGATMAVVIAKTSNRYEAGVLEVALKEHITGQTNWRKMLQGTNATKEEMLSAIARLRPVIKGSPHMVHKHEFSKISYPVQMYPKKVKSLGFNKQPQIAGILMGMKGQYLIFEDENVLNIRKHQGYCVDVVV